MFGGILEVSFLGVRSNFVFRRLIRAGMYADRMVFYKHLKWFCFYVFCVAFAFGFFACATCFSVTGFYGITCKPLAYGCFNCIVVSF